MHILDGRTAGTVKVFGKIIGYIFQNLPIIIDTQAKIGVVSLIMADRVFIVKKTVLIGKISVLV